jgi:hypothetical protein
VHSLWVYFLGEYFLRRCYDLPGLDPADEEDEEGTIVRPAGQADSTGYLRQCVTANVRAAWCVTALCHDLGYALEAVSPFHGRVSELFRIMGIPTEFLKSPGMGALWFSVSTIQSTLIDGVIPLASFSVILDRAKGVLGGINKNSHRSLCHQLRIPNGGPAADSEDTSRHGYASAYVIFNLARLECLLSDRVIRPGDPGEATEPLRRAAAMALWSTIIRSVCTHSSRDRPHPGFDSMAELLVLADELSERRTCRQGSPWRVWDTTWDIDVEEFKGGVKFDFHLGQEALAGMSQRDRTDAVNERFRAIQRLLVAGNGARLNPENDGLAVSLTFPERRELSSLVRESFLGVDL